MADEKGSSITDAMVADIQGGLAIEQGEEPAGDQPAAEGDQQEYKPGAERKTKAERDVTEVYDGTTWKEKPPEPPSEYDFDGKKYKADQIKTAIKDANDAHIMRSNATKELSTAAAVQRAAKDLFSFAERLGNNGELAASIRALVEDLNDPDALDQFDKLTKFKAGYLKDPMQEQIENDRREIAEQRYELAYAKEKESLKASRGTEGEPGYLPGLTDEEVQQVEEFANEQLAKDREKDPNAPILDLEKMYLLSPLYQQKLRESIEKAAKAQTDKEQGQPPRKSGGSPPPPKREPGQTKVTDAQAADILKDLGL